MPTKAWSCPRVFDNRGKKNRIKKYSEPHFSFDLDGDYMKEVEDKRKAWQDKGIPDYLLCNGFMNRVYIREVTSPNWNYDTHQYDGKVKRMFKPVGFYCKRCGLFCKDEDYSELYHNREKMREEDDKGYYKHHIGYFK